MPAHQPTETRVSMAVCKLLFAMYLGLAGDGSAAPTVTVSLGKKNGEMYPDFVLPKVGGGTLRLSDFRGRKVLLFQFASW